MRKISLLALSLIFPTVVFAAAGTPDITFSGDGLVTARIRTGDFSGNSHPSSVVIQSDGKIVTAGYAREGGSDQFALARFTASGVASGVLDPTFQGGTVITDLTECSDERIRAMALQPDGKIVVGGYCHHTDSNSDRFVVARYDTDGRLDTTFSGDGRVVLEPGFCSDFRINALTLQAGGGIIVAGYSFYSSSSTCAVRVGGGLPVLARVTAGGDLDTSFGFSENGYAFFPVTRWFASEAHAVAIQDGKVLFGGVIRGTTTRKAFIARCSDTDCRSLDSGFGVAGVASPNLEAYEENVKSISLQSDGKILAAGTATGVDPSGHTTIDLLLIRLDASGNPDPTFGNIDPPNGFLIKPISQRWTLGTGVMLAADGKIVATGYAVETTVTAGKRLLEFFVRRFESATGADDVGFGGAGLATVSLWDTNNFADGEAAIRLALEGDSQATFQSDGRIVVAGFSREDEIRDRFTVARVWDRPASDPEITSFTSDRDPVVKGANLAYPISYKNRTGDLAQGVVVTVRFSLAVELVAGDHGCGGQSLADGGVTVTCPRPDIATTDTGNELSFTVKPSVAGTLVATVQIGSAGHDITPSNSTRSLSVTVNETATDDDDDDDVDDEDDVDDPPADEGDQTPQPPPEFRERRSFEIAADDPAVTGESGSGGGCSFVPDASASNSPGLLWILLGSVPLFLVSLKELLRKKKT